MGLSVFVGVFIEFFLDYMLILLGFNVVLIIMGNFFLRHPADLGAHDPFESS